MTERRVERWTGRLGVLLAVAGSTIGLGSILRFPALLLQYDGGTFMVPYLCALLGIGLPLVWLEWAFGRFGGVWGCHNLPAIYHTVTRKPWGKYLGVLGLYAPFIVVVYYLYVESWALGYTFLGALGRFTGGQDAAALLPEYLGGARALTLPPLALGFLAVTLALNFYLVSRRGRAGIDAFTAVVMPIFFVLTAALLVLAFCVRGPSGLDARDALSLLWTPPTLAKLANPELWLAAVGQVLFTLSLGLGAVITYSSYLRKDDDVALSGFATVAFNSLMEIIVAGTLLVAAALMYLGPEQARALAAGGLFQVGFVALPLFFAHLPFGNVLGAAWFLLLFFAGLAASVSLLQPLIAFFCDELRWSRKKAVVVLLLMTVCYLAPVVLLQRYGFLADTDFWAANVLLAVGALVEIVIFTRVLGMPRGWEGITTGARFRVPGLCRFVLQYVAPLFLIVVLGAWAWRAAPEKVMLSSLIGAHGGAPLEVTALIIARVLMGLVLLVMVLFIRHAWRREHTVTRAQEDITHVA